MGSTAPKQRLVWAGMSLSLAEGVVNQCSPKNAGELHGFRVCFCCPAAGIVMGFSQLKKAEPSSGNPPFLPSFKKSHL